MLFYQDMFFLPFVISLRFCVRRQSASFADWKLEITVKFLKDFLMKTPTSSYCYNGVASRLCGACGACSLSKLQFAVHARVAETCRDEKICGRPWRRNAFVYPLVHLHVTCEWNSRYWRRLGLGFHCAVPWDKLFWCLPKLFLVAETFSLLHF